jgi:TolB-like protein
VLIIAVGALTLLAFVLLYFIPWRQPLDKSIAILPFRSVNENSADRFFAEGVHDDIVSRLVKIRDLTVIGHTGVADVFEGDVSNLSAIGRNLGVRHLVSGTLGHSGDRILLLVRLIDVRKGREIWSEGYNRRLRDAINLQGELASDIAEALSAKVSFKDRGAARASATYNPDAYMLYLRGRRLENSLVIQIPNYEAAQALYSQAVALDPGFALAHARLACVLNTLYRFGRPTEDLRFRAYFEVREALRLQPNLGEAHFANALNSYRIERDFDGALVELEIARRLSLARRTQMLLFH